jgi:hypothetical protein
MIKANILFFTILGILLALTIPMISGELGGGDFIAYWSSAHLLIVGGNPYDPLQMLLLQKETQPDRFNDQDALLNAWNPPWLLIALFPLGLLPFDIALRLWIILTTFIIAISIRYTWKLLNVQYIERDYLITILVGFTFGPTLSLLALGQISGLLLISLILSIYLLKTNRDFLAGAMVVFTLIKPHISYFFITYILMYVIFKKRWKFLWGLLGTILFSFISMLILLPDWIGSYISLLMTLPYTSVYSSTLGSLISEISGINYFQGVGLFLLPLMLFFSYRLSKGDLLTAVNIGLMISIPLAPFGFLFDQVALIPALVQIYRLGVKDQTINTTGGIIIIGYLILNIIVILLLAGINIPYYWFFWIPFGILSLFILARKKQFAKI